MKNLLIILIDELRSDVAFHKKYPFVKTPHLDHFRAQGVTVHNSFCQYPVCGPSRASLLTGQYPQQIGVMDNNSLLPEGQRTIGHHLADLGYTVDAFGKTHGMNPGFRLRPEPNAMQTLGTTNMGYKAASDSIVGVFEAGAEQHYDAIVAGETIAALREAQPPFAMFVGLHAPHPPLYPPREYAGLYEIDTLPEDSDAAELNKPKMQRQLAEERWLCHPTDVRRQMIANYLALVTFVDIQLGKLMQALADYGQFDDTVVVLTADHGDQLGEHNLIGKFNNFYDATIKLPLMLRLPDELHAGREIETLVEMVDLYPTLCDLIGVPKPVGLAGQSFVPSIEDAGFEHRVHVNCTMQGGHMVRSQAWKLAYYPDDLPELYHLTEDPDERHNLYNDPAVAGIRHDLMERLLDHLIRYRRAPSQSGLNQFLA